MRSEIRLSRSALVHNVRAFRRICAPKTQLMVVVKGNAYGHGVGECAPIFQAAGVQWFGVASVQEALALRRSVHQKSILVLSYLDGSKRDLVQAVRQRVRLPVYTLPMLRQIQQAAKLARRPALVHLKFDTGTSRIGFLPSDAGRISHLLRLSKSINVEGVYSHFAEVEARAQDFSQAQHERFKTITKIFERELGTRLLKHMDCSAGTLVHPDAHFDMVRVGIAAYGLYSVADVRRVHRNFPEFSLQPALRWYTELIQVKRVPAGTTIGYNRTYRCPRATTIGTLPVGYWEGYDRRLSNRGRVVVQGKRAPVRGRVCMNLTMVELPYQTRARAGTPVTLIGPGQTADQFAAKAGTITYEVLTRLHPSIPRRMVR